MASSCEYGNESSDSIIGGAFLDQMINYQVVKKHSAQYS
jgi:hypothetical protein